MIWSADLIEQAEFLASTKKDAGKPKEASLRRAVSAAYYALFHELNRTVANSLVGPSKSWDTYTPVYRMLDHKVTKSFFVRLRNRGSIEFTALGPAIADIGETFIRLQDERTRADYNPEPFPFGRYEVAELIAQAKASAEQLSALNEREKLALAVRLVTASKSR